MPYTNPAASASDAIQTFLLQQQAKKRQDMMDALDMQLKQAAIDRAVQEQGYSKWNMANQQNEHTPIGAVLTPEQIQQHSDAGAPYNTIDQPAVAAAPASVSIGSGAPGTTIGEGPTPAPVAATPAVAARPAQTVNAGTDAQQEESRQKADVAKFLADPNVPAEAKAYVQAKLQTGTTVPYELIQGPKTTLPASAQEYEYAVKHDGYKGTYEQYQTEDANRKKVTAPTNISLNLGDPTQAATVDMLAVRLANSGDTSGLGRGGLQSPLGFAVAQRAAQYDKATGTFSTSNTAPDLAAAKAGFGADSKALAALQLNMDTVGAYTRTAKYNADKLKQLMKDVPDTGIPWFNTPYRSLETNLGANRALARIGAIRQSVQNEYSRISSQPSLSGVLSDSARKEFETILNPNATPEMMDEALNVLQMEAENRLKGFEEQKKEIAARISPAKGEPTTRPATATSGGLTYNPLNGKVE